jgi:hypothetical protein
MRVGRGPRRERSSLAGIRLSHLPGRERETSRVSFQISGPVSSEIMRMLVGEAGFADASPNS